MYDCFCDDWGVPEAKLNEWFKAHADLCSMTPASFRAFFTRIFPDWESERGLALLA